MKQLATIAAVAALVLSACSSAPLTTTERAQYAKIISAGTEPADEYSPTLGAVLGILPGGGSFYLDQPWVGFAGLLMWPVSVAWEVPNAIPTARDMNVRATIEKATIEHALRDPE